MSEIWRHACDAALNDPARGTEPPPGSDDAAAAATAFFDSVTIGGPEHSYEEPGPTDAARAPIDWVSDRAGFRGAVPQLRGFYFVQQPVWEHADGADICDLGLDVALRAWVNLDWPFTCGHGQQVRVRTPPNSPPFWMDELPVSATGHLEHVIGHPSRLALWWRRIRSLFTRT
jgi:hypothetical protein